MGGGGGDKPTNPINYVEGQQSPAVGPSYYTGSSSFNQPGTLDSYRQRMYGDLPVTSKPNPDYNPNPSQQSLAGMGILGALQSKSPYGQQKNTTDQYLTDPDAQKKLDYQMQEARDIKNIMDMANVAINTQPNVRFDNSVGWDGKPVQGQGGNTKNTADRGKAGVQGAGASPTSLPRFGSTVYK